MNRTEFTQGVLVLVSATILLVWIFALIDIARRRDVAPPVKVIYGAVLIAIPAITVLYLLSRPTSLVRHRERVDSDWRKKMMDQLDARPGDPPVMSRSDEGMMSERIAAVESENRPEHLSQW